MAIVLDNVVIELADAAVTAATNFLNALQEIERVKAQADGQQINFNTFDTVLASVSGLKHADGAAINRIINDVGPQVRTLVTTPNTSGTQTLLKRLYDVHRGTR